MPVLAARDKQAAIKDRFRAWVFADEARTERLVRAYNDAYNALRLRQFDGSHLRFPGLSAGVTLRPHQADAAWRCVAGGNTLLAHCVGAGKTYTMAAAGMKLRQAGLARKPMYVVPNHLLEQFAREFLHLYPTAKLLVAGKEDLSKERRKLLTAQIAAGDWDGIVVTHSSFERIGMSRELQAEFLREQIAEYDRLLADRSRGNPSLAQRNLIKTVEKQKARREDKLKELLAADKKDDGLVFDELGVDHLFVDEAHAFKNLETPTKMERVAGVQTGGSERAFDLLTKCRFLHRKNAGRGVTFATGTPVSNTMVELYTLQRYLDPAGLAAAGIAHFDAWAAAFGEVVDAMEIAPDGATLRPRSRFAKFVNLPELQQMFRRFADVQTADMLDLPRPALAGGKPQTVTRPMSDTQAALQHGLVERYEKLRSSKVDPRVDNALAVTTDGRKLALDARLLSPDAGDDPDSKLNALVENVARVWRETTPTKGTQLVFCDLGVRPTAWGFSVYDEVIRKLVAHGIPAEQIAAVGEAESDAKKQALFERVRAGRVRVLLGSTQKMGAGTNVQTRLAALHHLDAPWKPAEVEQREGRILRQGNTNAEVAVYRYVTEGSFDAYLWQALETKAKFIGQVMTGESGVRRAADVGEQTLSYAEVKALASGNPAVLTLAEADAEVQRLGVLKRAHADEQFLARRAVRDLPGEIERLERRLDALEADRATADGNRGTPAVIGGRPRTADQVGPALAAVLDRLPDDPVRAVRAEVGSFRGLAWAVARHPGGSTDVLLAGRAERGATLARDAHGPRAVLNATNRLADGYAEACDRVRGEADVCRRQLADFTARLGAAFPHADRQAELVTLRDQLQQALAAPPPGPAAADSDAPDPPTTTELSHRLKALLAAPRVDGEGTKRSRPATWAERTTRRTSAGSGQGTGPRP